MEDPYEGRAPEPKRCFSDIVECYKDHRPTYPEAAIAFILDGVAPDAVIADIGCGTGISSRPLAHYARRVIGLDHNPEMLLAARHADHGCDKPVTYRFGTAEATGLADAVIDVVLCAQSFHWFDTMCALREFHRVLRAGGRLALMWYSIDKNDGAGHAFRRITERAQQTAEAIGRTVRRSRDADPTVGGWFRNARRSQFSDENAYTLDRLVGCVSSASYFPTAGPLRNELIEELHALFQHHQRDGVVMLRQHTLAIIADRA